MCFLCYAGHGRNCLCIEMELEASLSTNIKVLLKSTLEMLFFKLLANTASGNLTKKNGAERESYTEPDRAKRESVYGQRHHRIREKLLNSVCS